MSSRVFLRLAYNGAHFSGWQIQPNAPTVQDAIQVVLGQMYGTEMKVIGCGRTDTGVHASEFYAHTDLPTEMFSHSELNYKLNNMLPKGIVVYDVIPVSSDAHARFDAHKRSYVYKMTMTKNPFQYDTVYRYDQAGRPDFEKMNEAVELLGNYTEFFPFCKTHADVNTFTCLISDAQWTEINKDEYHFHISANRFLRGMVRLIVGMSINVGLGRVTFDEVRDAMEKQERLERAWSVPASGLFLNKISYPYL